MLSGEVVGPTNSSGIVCFTDLKILASTSNSVYIIFYVDGQVGTSWQPYINSFEFSNVTVPILILPIKMRDTGDDAMVMMITREPSKFVKEGEDFPVQPAFRLFYKNTMSPVTGVGCVALVNSKNDGVYPKGYRLTFNCIFILI